MHSIDMLEERAEYLNKLRKNKIVDLYHECLVHCEDTSEVFEHYLQHSLHHFWYILFEFKILLNGRLHDENEEARYTDYILDGGQRRGHFYDQDFNGPESELACVLSELSVDGIHYGVLHTVR